MKSKTNTDAATNVEGNLGVDTRDYINPVAPPNPTITDTTNPPPTIQALLCSALAQLGDNQLAGNLISDALASLEGE